MGVQQSRDDNTRTILVHLPRPPSMDKLPTEKTSVSTVLVVQGINFHIKENVTSHFTGNYDIVQLENPSLVIRRGFPFKLGITFHRPYDEGKDGVCLVFTAKDAETPSYSQASMIFCPVMTLNNSGLLSDGWQTKVLSVEKKGIELEVTPTPMCIVGDWVLDVDTKVKKEPEEQAISLRYTCKQPLYILFNPWCKQDTVYLSDSEHRKEYVLNEGGLIWRGTNNSFQPTAWNYGQFDEDILQCSCYLLGHIAKLSIVARADPVQVVRHISAVVNTPDDRGVVWGRWTDDYKGGQVPTSWGGSVAILQQYYKSKKPVKYGQCWVFAGVVTTVCRALGIAVRTVTNFSSAHDTHNSLTIDYFYDKDDEPLKRLNIDSVWNFHVWNEVWMERPDLEPGGYSGWQVIDATPQERSDGQYRCGPCNVAAIKRGEILKAYDAPFIFAEVNADSMYWRYFGKNNPRKLIRKDTKVIGQFISTKAVGSYKREDITTKYKHVEDTREEREVMLRVLRQSRNVFSRYYLNDEFEDVTFDFELLHDVVIGSPFNVKLRIKNKGLEKKSYTVKGVLHVNTVLYTGEQKNIVRKHRFEEKIAEKGEKVVTVQVSYEDYERMLVDQAAFKILSMAQVKETGFDYFAQDDFRVRKPDIKIEIEGDPTQGQEFKVTAQFKNPLPKPLKEGLFTIEGPGLGQPLKRKIKGDVPPYGTAEATCNMTPKTSGDKTIVAKFWCPQLDDVDGYKLIQVKPKT